MFFKQFSPLSLALLALIMPDFVASQTQNSAPAVSASAAVNNLSAAVEAQGLNDWLRRMHRASRNRAYIGTYVVSSGGQIQSAKIWHVCQAGQQTERVETLTGAPRSTFRHNEKVVTFMPEQKLVRHEKRDVLGAFPEMIQSADYQISDFYRLKLEGVERVAGVDADIAVLRPKDAMRFGYRVWTEQKKGLVVKLQTLDADGRVLEQAAFSELLMDAPVNPEKLLQMMGKVEGYRVEQPALLKTTAGSEGWRLSSSVAGFRPLSCYKRPASASAALATEASVQWIFSDGLASVSLFVEAYDKQRHSQESAMIMGATHTLTRQVGSYWLTAMGEVPMATLKQFASGLERKK